MFTQVRGEINERPYFGFGLNVLFPGETVNDVRHDIMHFVPELEIETTMFPTNNIYLTNRRKKTDTLFDKVQLMVMFNAESVINIPTKKFFGLWYKKKPFYEMEALIYSENQTVLYRTITDLLIRRFDVGVKFKPYETEQEKRANELQLNKRLMGFCKNVHIGDGVIPEKVYARKKSA